MRKTAVRPLLIGAAIVLFSCGADQTNAPNNDSSSNGSSSKGSSSIGSSNSAASSIPSVVGDWLLIERRNVFKGEHSDFNKPYQVSITTFGELTFQAPCGEVVYHWDNRSDDKLVQHVEDRSTCTSDPDVNTILEHISNAVTIHVDYQDQFIVTGADETKYIFERMPSSCDESVTFPSKNYSPYVLLTFESNRDANKALKFSYLERNDFAVLEWHDECVFEEATQVLTKLNTNTLIPLLCAEGLIEWRYFERESLTEGDHP